MKHIKKLRAVLSALYECALITRERVRQITQENWTPEHDNKHRGGVLAIQAAALCIEHTDAALIHPDYEPGERVDPWGLVRKHMNTERRLQIAGALIAAELGRKRRLMAWRMRQVFGW